MSEKDRDKLRKILKEKGIATSNIEVPKNPELELSDEERLNKLREIVGGSSMLNSLSQGPVTTPKEQPIEQDNFDPSFIDVATALPDLALTFGSSFAAEAAGGLSGLADTALRGIDQGVDTAYTVRDALTYESDNPMTQEVLKRLGENLGFIGEGIQKAEKFIGDEVYDSTGSATLGALATTIPAATLEILGFVGGRHLRKIKSPSNKAVNKAIMESAPEVDNIKRAAKRVYEKLDTSRITVKKEVLDKFVQNLEKSAKRKGLHPTLTDQGERILRQIKKDIATDQPIGYLDTMHKMASRLSASADDTMRAIGANMVDEIDQFMDSLSGRHLKNAGTQPTRALVREYKAARQLWGRVRRAETIDEILTNASRARDMESSLRNQFRSLLKSKKRSRFFSKDELRAMDDLVKGNFAQNSAKLIGRLGFSDGQMTAMLAGIGGAYLAAGSGAALAVPFAGAASRSVAKSLTKRLVDRLQKQIRAGAGAKEIVRSYLKAVPKNKRSAADLADILSDPSIDLEALEFISNQVVKDAKEIAKGRRAITLAVTGVGVENLRTGFDEETEND